MPEHRPGSIERILDAAANRAREGLRVVEDYVRFVLADEELSRRARDTRHRVTELAKLCVPGLALLKERDTPGDLGADPETFRTPNRASALTVVLCAFKRAQEALRSLGEFSRLTVASVGGGFESLRYEVYELEKASLAAALPRVLLERATVALITTLASADARLPQLDDALPLARTGCHVLVVRAGNLNDLAFLEAARQLRSVCDETETLLFIAARADVARLAGADGVLVGETGLPVPVARQAMPQTALVAYAAQSVYEANLAALDGADAVFLEASGKHRWDEFVEWTEDPLSPCFATGFTSVDEALAREELRRVAFGASTVDADQVRRAVEALATRG